MHWLVVLAIVLLLFGAGKLPRVMGDFAKGIKAFKSGMKEDEAEAPLAAPQLAPATAIAANPAKASEEGTLR
jgi:sec-independent protein translocase protein TatA